MQGSLIEVIGDNLKLNSPLPYYGAHIFFDDTYVKHFQ